MKNIKAFTTASVKENNVIIKFFNEIEESDLQYVIDQEDGKNDKGTEFKKFILNAKAGFWATCNVREFKGIDKVTGKFVITKPSVTFYKSVSKSGKEYYAHYIEKVIAKA